MTHVDVPAGGSGRSQLHRRLAALVDETESTAGWTASGFRPDLSLLGRILARTNPMAVRSGEVPTGMDVWTAAMLRTAGLQGVVPQAREPFFAGRTAAAARPALDEMATALRKLDILSAELRGHPAAPELAQAVRTLRRELRSLRRRLEVRTDTVLGEGRRKQTDVFIAEWDRGLELLVSTKTIAVAAEKEQELKKNLANRWEEFDGDLKNLRGRFPLAVIGILTLVPASTVHKGSLAAFVDMLTKLRAPGRPWVNAYDATCLLVADWEAATAEEVPIVNPDLGPERLPKELQPDNFFDELLRRLFERSPIAEHQEARARAEEARGGDPDTLRRAARLEAEAPAE